MVSGIHWGVGMYTLQMQGDFCVGLFRSSISSNVSFAKELVYFTEITTFVDVDLIIVFFYYAFNITGICSDTYFFIPDISNCVLSFFLSLARSLSILLIFSKTYFLIC